MDFTFKKATAQKLKLKLLLMGEAGSGKTYTALSLATRLTDLEGGKIALIDSEGADGKAQLYAPYFDFYHLCITDHSPETYCKAISAAIHQGFTVIIVDSFTQEWNGTNGAIEISDKAKTGWAEAKTRHRKLIQTIHDSNVHIIGTVRTKNTYAKTDTGSIDWKNSVVDARQEGEFEFEWDMSALLRMEDDTFSIQIRKSRCFDIKRGTEYQTEEEQTQFIFELNTWLNAGTEPPHWTENERQLARVNAWIKNAREHGKEEIKLHLAGALADIDKSKYDTPEGYRQAIINYCKPEAVIARRKAINEQQKQSQMQNQQSKIKNLGAYVPGSGNYFEPFDDLVAQSGAD